ncbi:MAG: Ldh family oxidoreductase, partial [Clostridia bacterium]|nr:Ldh family oxidoreductase [Clostridia bacterium]
MGYQIVNAEKARHFCERVFESYGFTAEESATIADVLLTADLYGIESHGVQRLVRYIGALKEGSIDPKAPCTTIFETPLSAVWDAPRSMGQIVARRGMETAIEKAKQHGFGMVAVRGSNHYGIAGYYTKMAAEADMIGIC